MRNFNIASVAWLRCSGTDKQSQAYNVIYQVQRMRAESTIPYKVTCVHTSQCLMSSTLVTH